MSEKYLLYTIVGIACLLGIILFFMYLFKEPDCMHGGICTGDIIRYCTEHPTENVSPRGDNCTFWIQYDKEGVP